MRKEKLYNGLLYAYTQLKNKQLILQKEKDNLEKKMSIVKSGTIVVMGKSFPGVKIRIGMGNILVEDEIQKVIYEQKDGSIVTNNI